MEQTKKMPLEGIRVVELATVVAAPTASRVLCAFGAEVIKVETKIGDEMRRAKPGDGEIAEIEGMFHECVGEWERQYPEKAVETA